MTPLPSSASRVAPVHASFLLQLIFGFDIRDVRFNAAPLLHSICASPCCCTLLPDAIRASSPRRCILLVCCILSAGTELLHSIAAPFQIMGLQRHQPTLLHSIQVDPCCCILFFQNHCMRSTRNNACFQAFL